MQIVPVSLIEEGELGDSAPPKSVLATVRNVYGNVDVRKGVPDGLCVIKGFKFVEPLARKMGIECCKAFTGYSKSYGRYKPHFGGVVVAESDADRLLEALRERKERNQVTSEKRAERSIRRRESKQKRETSAFEAMILARFPCCPPVVVAVIAAHTTEIGSCRVGRSNLIDDPVLPAVVAHIRHAMTDYERIMDTERARWGRGFDPEQARERAKYEVRPLVNQILAQWEFGE